MPEATALPKYIQTAELLIREIAAGRLIDGERLPPERNMASDMGIAVGTLRKALDSLEDRGLLKRRQGSGNYVRARPDAESIYAFFRLELIDGGGLPSARVISVDRLEKPADLPEFGHSPEAHRIRRLRLLSDTPAALEEIWLDCRWAHQIEPEDLHESLYLFYRKSLNLWIARAEDRVSVGAVPYWREQSFGQETGTIVGLAERWSQTPDGEVAEYSRSWFDPAVARYVARLR